MSSLRLVFMGTPDFAVPAMRALANAGHTIAAVYCQPPKPAGRGHHLQKTPVHLAAEESGFAIRTPKSLRGEEEQQKLAATAPDAIVVAAYGLILPQAVLDIPRLGCFNIHGSLLPRWRGAAPIHRALLAGDAETGITIMQMDAGLDTGAMLLKGSVPITPQSTAQSLHDTLATLGATLIVKAMDSAARGELRPEAQPEEGSCYAAKLTKEEGALDWTRPAAALDLQIRALTPWPGTFFKIGEETIKVHAATLVAASGKPGTILDDKMTIACGEHALRLTLVQRAGKKPTDGVSFFNGLRLPVGHVFS